MPLPTLEFLTLELLHTESPVIHQLLIRFSSPDTSSSGSFCSCKLYCLHLSVCLSNVEVGQFVLWPCFSHYKSCCFSVCSAFFLWRQEWWSSSSVTLEVLHANWKFSAFSFFCVFFFYFSVCFIHILKSLGWPTKLIVCMLFKWKSDIKAMKRMKQECNLYWLL